MSVYERSYRRYEGPLHGGLQLPVALARYTYEEMRRSRLLTPVLYGGFLWPVISLLMIYLRNNADALQVMGVNPRDIIVMDTTFFYVFLSLQSFVAFVVAALAGPGCIAPDLANRALSSILARPISRTGYVIGRMLPLVAMLSAITWVPGLIVVGAQVAMGESGWLAQYWRIPITIFFGFALWVGVLSLMAMALSAWVRWKPVAGGLMFAIFFILTGLGAMFDAMLDMHWGQLVSMPTMVATVWVWLMEGSVASGGGSGFFTIARDAQIPVWLALLMIGLFCLLCVLLLASRIRGAEVMQ